MSDNNLMTGIDKIIPTPKFVIKENKGCRVYLQAEKNTIILYGKRSEKLSYAAEFLMKNIDYNFSIHNGNGEKDIHFNENDVIICNNPALLESEYLEQADLDLFKNRNAQEQGYIIKNIKGQPLILCGMSDISCLYAVSTLLQMLKPYACDDLSGICLNYFIIRDYPDFKYRGNNWLIASEAGIWSYDRGDGIEKYKKRFINKLDLCLKYKINLVHHDALGWDAEKFPKYGNLIKDLNHEARRRGIHLMSAGYGSSYGASGWADGTLHKGKVFKNQTSYPNGTEYPCQGNTDYKHSAYFGTCLSNKTLMRLKQEELSRFVSEIQPGALYIHNTDVFRVADLAWKDRCEECREKWPDDDMFSENGAAGAYAGFYDRLAECIKEVKDPGYDADRDCLIFFVSPIYTWFYITDEEWKEAVRYWAAVSRFMKQKDNIVLTFREQFFNHGYGGVKRLDEMRDAIHRDGSGHDSGFIYFYGADGYYNDKFFIPTPILNYMYRGADMILNASGNAYQEPLQLLNAEYAWNSEHSSFYNLKNKPDNYDDFMKLYNQCQQGSFKPEGIYGSDGFLETACCKLYGDMIGKDIASALKLTGNHYESPVAYLINVDIFTGYFQLPRVLSWQPGMGSEKIREYTDKFAEIRSVTLKVKDIFHAIRERSGIGPDVQEEMDWFYESTKIAALYMGMLCDYINIYGQLEQYFEIGEVNKIKAEEIKLNINKNFVAKLESAREAIMKDNLKPIDYMGGALCGRDSILDFLEENIAEMMECIDSGKRHLHEQKEMLEWW